MVIETPIEPHSDLVFNPKVNTNPFKQIRLQLNLTQEQLASRCGITKHAVLRNEQGMAVEPLPVLLHYFSENFPINTYELRTAYEKFQMHQRSENSLPFGIPSNLQSELEHWLHFQLASPQSISHPFRYLLTLHDYNPTSFSRDLCLNQSVINYFLNNPIHQKTIPEQLLVALKHSGYNDTVLTYLSHCYDKYRELSRG